MKIRRAQPVFLWAARLLLAAVFVAAAIPKIADPQGFALSVFRYRLAPYGLINLTAIYLPWMELTAATALLCWPRGRTAAAAGIFILLLFFTGLVTITLVRGLDVACGCFTTAGESPLGWPKVIQNLLLTLLSAWLVRMEYRHAGQVSSS